MEEKVFKGVQQTIFLENRQKITITDVNDIGAFNEEIVHLSTTKGGTIIKGANLKIQKLDLQEGKVIISGTVNSVTYTDKEEKKDKNILGKLFK